MIPKGAHTPGPWYPASGSDRNVIAIDAPPASTGYDESIEICLVSNQDEGSAKANAELIAAAPMLLKLLRDVAGDSICMRGFYEEFRTEIRNTIKLAEGKK